MWEATTVMTATLTDDRRRLVMPPGLPAKSPVTIQQIDEDTWIVKRQREQTNVVFLAIPVIEELPRDPEWEAIEGRMVEYNNRHLAPFEE